MPNESIYGGYSGVYKDVIWFDARGLDGSAIWSDSFIWNDQLFDSLGDSWINLYNLLPTGDIWPPINEDTTLKKLIKGMVRPINAVHNTLDAKMLEVFPDQFGEFVQEWETLMELPKCPNLGTMTTQERVAVIMAMYSISPYSNVDFFVNIAALFGYDISITIDPNDPFRIPVVVNSVAEIVATAGITVAGARLIEEDVGALECILRYFKHVHTYLDFQQVQSDVMSISDL